MENITWFILGLLVGYLIMVLRAHRFYKKVSKVVDEILAKLDEAKQT